MESTMTTPDLAGEILRILNDEKTYPAMSADSLQNVLRALGFSPLPDRPRIVEALGGLMESGAVECRHSIRLGPRYRVTRGDKAAEVA